MNFFNHQQIDRVHDGVRDKDSLISGWRNDGNHTIRMIKLNYLKKCHVYDANAKLIQINYHIVRRPPN